MSQTKIKLNTEAGVVTRLESGLSQPTWLVISKIIKHLKQMPIVYYIDTIYPNVYHFINVLPSYFLISHVNSQYEWCLYHVCHMHHDTKHIHSYCPAYPQFNTHLRKYTPIYACGLSSSLTADTSVYTFIPSSNFWITCQLHTISPLK